MKRDEFGYEHVRRTRTIALAALLVACGGPEDAAPDNGEAGGGAGQLSTSAGAAEAGGLSSTAGSSTAGSGASGGSEDAGESSLGGSVDGPAGSGGEGGDPFVDDGVQETANRVDVLFMVDNSISLGVKQALLSDSVAEFVERLTNPFCIDPDGAQAPVRAQDSEQDCPAGTEREFSPITDMHLGVISSSLGGHGGDLCSPGGQTWNEAQNDHGHLIPTVRPDLPSYMGQGFLKWDGSGSDLEATSSPDELSAELSETIDAVGTTGCGYEAQLEAMYRFLIDPEPPLEVVAGGAEATVSGIDEELLEQRSNFLRPDSSVLIVMLTDENDCSIVDGGPGQFVAVAASYLPPATSACDTDPNSECCRSCGLSEVSPPAGCTSQAEDPACATSNDPNTDPLNLRCFDQKRRFGVDFLYPLSRYTRGLRGDTVPARDGRMVQNPLFSGGRHPSLVSLLVIAGVPRQDLVEDPSASDEPSYLSVPELTDASRKALIVGDPENGTPPTDPFMIESIDPRSGTHPLTGDAIEPPDTTTPNPINRHEYLAPDGFRYDLQFACLSPLPEVIDCSLDDTGTCDCVFEEADLRLPQCEDPNAPGNFQSRQYFTTAYPGIRPLQVAFALGRTAAIGSICARNVEDPLAPDYGYQPALDAAVRRLSETLQ